MTSLDGVNSWGAPEAAVGVVGDLSHRVLALHGDCGRRSRWAAFPGLAGVLPGFGRQTPMDWGLGFDLKDNKFPHWTARSWPVLSDAVVAEFGPPAERGLTDVAR